MYTRKLKLNKELLCAALKNDTDTYTDLVMRGANINYAGVYKTTPLMLCVKKGFIQFTKRLIDDNADLNYTDKNGCTAIFGAAINGHPSILSTLMKNGANPDIQNNIGRTALCHITQASEVTLSNILKDTIHQHDKNKDSSERIHPSVRHDNQIACLKVLLAEGADPTIPDDYGKTPVDYASSPDIQKLIEAATLRQCKTKNKKHLKQDISPGL